MGVYVRVFVGVPVPLPLRDAHAEVEGDTLAERDTEGDNEGVMVGV